jgi:hypothetical protein
MLSSTSAKRSPAASRTQPILRSIASGARSDRSSAMVPFGRARGRMPTMSASRPAMASIRLEPAPIASGG